MEKVGIFEENFYTDAALKAMQVLLENSARVSNIDDLDLEFLAKKSFDIADSMLAEYRKRMQYGKATVLND